MHPGGMDFRSPQSHMATSHKEIGTPQDFISPTTKKRVGITSPAMYITPSVVNDDEAEKRERRRSKVLEFQRRHLNSPATPSERSSASPPLSGLTNNQLAEHYANCIKLSTENKINAKNAFGLHLIDHMSELLKKKEMTNFQVASSTLDASAKIYAGRVDAIHSETYKVLTGLGRGAEKENKDEEDILATEEQEGPPGAKKRKRAKRGKTIENNLRNINVHKLDLAFETDPLFHKTSAAFDEGGTAGLLLNHLHCRDDMSELVLDSNTVLTDLDESMSQTHDTQPTAKPGAIRELKQMFLGLHLDNAHICPEFVDFEFTNWSSDREAGFCNKAGKSCHAFDMEAEAESIPETTESEGDVQQDYPDDGFGPLMDPGEDEDEDTASRCGDIRNLSGQSFVMGDNKEAQMVQKTIKNIKHGTVGTLIQVLATEPSDYSYFNTSLLQTWAGPAHWKLRPKSKGDLPPGPDGDHVKKPREKKEAFVNNYDEEINFEKQFKETRAATMLTRGTLDKYSKSQTTLPEDLHYEEEKLFKLFSKPRVMIKRQKRRSTAPIDEQIDNYDYDNTKDKDNFCPVGDDDGGDDDDNIGGFDFTGGTTQFSQTQDTCHEGQEDMEAMLGDNLVAQPRKVAKIDIGYAKTAKKMDVKRLKTSIWSLLTSPPKEAPMTEEGQNKDDEDKQIDDVKSDKETEKEQQQDEEERAEKTEAASPHTDLVAEPHSFQTIVKELPEKVSKNMAKNLSVPIAFVCLLHLANEKTLDLKSNNEMTDISISQA